MTPKVQDGRPLVSGVVKAQDQNAEIHGNWDTPGGDVPLTPAQKISMDRDEWPETVGAPGYESHRLTVRTDRELAEEKSRRAVREAASPAPAVESAERAKAATAATAVAALRDDFHAHAAKLKTMAAEAKGDAKQEAHVAAEIRKSAAVGAELKRRKVI